MQTMRLPEALNDIEDFADFLAQEVAKLERYVLVGYSFGAIIETHGKWETSAASEKERETTRRL